MRVIIAGGREFSDYALLKSKMDDILKNVTEEIEIISGTAKGADSLGERYAKENGYPVIRFPAEWNKYGNKAGPLRNKEMAKAATHCVCFWDGKSRGTKNMIDNCVTYNLPHRVIRY